jgi:N6-L-threonylcarbamoyladenine synthase
MKGYNYSFSGLKTSILYFLQKQTKINPSFIEDNRDDLCASVQRSITNILFKKVIQAAKDLGISEIAIAGGVSANSEIRSRLVEEGKKRNWNVYIPKFEYCTDNAAMIAITGLYMHKAGMHSNQAVSAQARIPFSSLTNPS